MFERGKVILVPFPFTDLSQQKIRPAVIISKDNRSTRDVIVLFISSILNKQTDTNVFLIQSSDKGFRATGLKRDSVVVCNKIATLDKGIVLGELGHLSTQQLKAINKKLVSILGL